MSDASRVDRIDVEAVNAKDKRSYYQKRKRIHPKRVQGTFRRLRWILMAMTLFVYYVTPWLRWDRGPYAPDQAVLVDLANRRFYFFFIEIWPQEFYYIAGLLVMAGIGLFLVTSTVGRAWCGYACPQTVWVDLYIAVERFFEGDRNARIRLDKAPWNADKITKRVLKHTVWILIALATGGAWIFYFADAPTLFVALFTGTALPIAYLTIAILAFTTYVFGGFLREQVCTYMCPWPRIQAAMLDENSLVVTYNDWRGEPRSRHAKRALAQGRTVGDCVDCNACVAVCPMGIDIRDGQQLECITCALCIDACDAIMGKLGRPAGLISYATLADYNANMALATTADGNIDPNRVYGEERGHLLPSVRAVDLHTLLRPRTILYTAVVAVIGLAMLVVLMLRDRLDISVLHDRNPVFVMLSDGSVRNGYTIKILNMLPQPRTFILTLADFPNASMIMAGSDTPASDRIVVDVEPDKLRSIRVYVRADADQPGGSHRRFRFVVRDANSEEMTAYAANFEAP